MTSRLPILCCLLLLPWLPAEEGGGDDPARADQTPPAGEETETEVEPGSDVLEEVGDEIDVMEAQKLAEAEALYLEARALYRKAYFVEALERVERACAIFPAHREAQQLRSDIEGLLAVRHDRLKLLADWVAQLGDVARQEQAIRLGNLIKKGDKLLNAGEFTEALRAYDSVAVAIQAFPYRFDWGALPEQIEEKKHQAMSLARNADLERKTQQLREAQEKMRIEAAKEEAALKAKVDQILKRAYIAYKRRDYKRASIEALNAYELDRRRRDARTLYLKARRAAHVEFDDWYRRERPERLSRINEEIHMKLIPQDELLVYPQDWDLINQRQFEDIGEDKEEPWRAELERRLQQEVTFVWEDTAIEDAIEFLRRTTGVNFIIDTQAIATGVPPISLQAENMKLKTALNWITKITRLRMTIKNQVVFLSTEEVQGDVTLRLYTITDLLSPVEDFPGPELTFSGGAAGGGGGFDVFGDAGGDAVALAPEDVMDFIRASVATDSWGVGAAAMEARQGGTLFISQTPEVHGQIEQLLANLRAQSSLQVNVKLRVLDVTKAFIEEIGIQWQDLPTNQGMLASTTQDGFTRINSDTLAFSRTSNALPSNAALTAIPGGTGLNVESSYNLTNMFNTPQLNFMLSALELENDATVLNAPEITLFNGQRGNYQFISQFAFISDYQIETGGGAGTYDPVIEVLNLGDIIDVRPLVSADRKYITMEMRPTSRLLAGTFVETIFAVTTLADVVLPLQFPIELPNVEVRSVRTSITIPDQGSLLIGGFTRGLRQRMHSGIPFLSHIPFLGRLFSKNGLYDEQRRLYFLVTGTIIDLNEMEEQQ